MLRVASSVRARLVPLACAVALVSCGDDKDTAVAPKPVDTGASAPATPPASAPPASSPSPTPGTTPTPPPAVSRIEFAQTHVIEAEGRALQSPNDVKNNVTRRLRLVEDRAALLMLEPTTPSATLRLQVRAKLADGRTLGPLSLAAPSALPATDGGRAARSTTAYSVLLPKAWVQRGAQLELGGADFSAPRSIPMTVTPAVVLKQVTVPLYLFGARPDRSVVPDWSMDATSTAGRTLAQEYAEKLPVARFEQVTSAPVTFDQLVLPPRNDDRFCHPALPVASWADLRSLEGDTNARMWNVLGAMHGPAANRDGAMAVGYYGYVQTLDGGTQVAAATGGGLGGGGSAVSGGDYRPDKVYSAIFNHEMGHAYGLPHADAAAAAGDDPYPMGTKSGSSWGYDAGKGQLLSPLQFAGASCDGRVVSGVCYQRTPMSGGDDDRDAKAYRWSMFSDYQSVLMQEGFLGKVVRDDNAAGGYKRWNAKTSAFEAMSDEERARIGTDVLKPGEPVQTVVGHVSHFNASPTASRLYVTPSWSANLPRQLDPTVQADLDLIDGVRPGGWNGYYCVNNGCDYTLVATYADGSVVRVLLPLGYRNFNAANDETGINAATRNALDGANLGTFAVNVPAGRGGVTRVQLYSTPFGSKWRVRLTAVAAADLGGTRYPLVTSWTTADGAGGGTGAPGATTFDTTQCKAGATVRRPAR